MNLNTNVLKIIHLYITTETLMVMAGVRDVMSVKLILLLTWVTFIIVQSANMIYVKIAVKIMISMERKLR